MRFFRNLPIKRKLVLITMLTSSIALVVACAAFVTYEQLTTRKKIVQNLSVTAKMTGANSAAGLTFNERGSVEQSLQSLSVQPSILFACVYDKEGKPFARYHRPDADGNLTTPKVEAAGHHFGQDQLGLFEEINLAGEKIGTVYLRMDLSEMTARIWRYLLIVGGVLLASGLIAFFLSAGLQKVISEPILELVRTTRAVAQEKDYSVRAAGRSRDELGVLIDGFNEMLTQIQARDAALSAARDGLELRVAERTNELANSLSLLNATLDATADGILAIDRQNKVLCFNPKVAALWGFTAERLASKRTDELMTLCSIQTRDAEQFLKCIRECQATLETELFHAFELNDGRSVELFARPQWIGQQCVGSVLSFRDVTARKRAQEAAAREQARFKLIFETVPVGIASHLVDADGRMIQRIINDAHLRVCGLTREQHDLPGIYAKLIQPEDFARQTELHRQVQEGKINQYTMEKRYRRLDGTVVWVVFSYQKQFYADGSMEELTTVVDITERKDTEQALRESQVLYHSLVEQMPTGIFRKDAAGRFVFVNSCFCRFKRMTADQILGRTAAELAMGESQNPYPMWLPAVATQGNRDHEQIMQTGRKIEVEEAYACAEGQRQYLHVVKSAVFSADGQITGSQGILFDITDRKRAEAELAYERDLLRTLLDNSPDQIYFKDAQSRFLKSSKAQAENFGVKDAGELIGKTDFDFFAEEHARPAFEDEQEIMRTGQPMIGKMEKEVWPDGRVSWVLASKMPLRNRDGEIIGTFGTSKDITAIKQAEAELAYERDLLRALLDNSPDQIYFKDLQSRFLKSSKAQAMTFGVPDAAAMVGKSDFDFFTEEHARPAYEDEQEIIRTGRPLIGKVETEFWKDGRVTWALTSKMPLRNQDGKIIGTLGVSKDITAMKQAEAKLEAVHRELLETSRLAGMAEVATSVLHNVGNVLNSVNTSASVITDLTRASKSKGISKLAVLFEENRKDLAGFLARENRGAQVITYLKILAQQLASEQTTVLNELQELTKNIDHIKEIVSMQQSYAKMSGLVEVQSPAALVEDALRMHVGGLERHQVKVTRQFQEIPDIPLDKHKVLQILVNLISNAKYALSASAATERMLTLNVRQNGDGLVHISVSDNGVGIAPENLTRIFAHGFTTKKNGHGFGLHSGALAAREMGGSLLVESDGLGKGATFTLELPADSKNQFA